MAAFDFTDLYNALSAVDDKMCAIRQKKALLEQKKAEIVAHRAKLIELASKGGCRMTRAMKAEYDLIQKADRTLDDILNQLGGLTLS
jgi:hypothetical protein